MFAPPCSPWWGSWAGVALLRHDLAGGRGGVPRSCPQLGGSGSSHWSDDRRGVALRHGELRAGRVAGIAMSAAIAPHVGARNRRRCLSVSCRDERRFLVTCGALNGSWHGHSPFGRTCTLRTC